MNRRVILSLAAAFVLAISFSAQPQSTVPHDATHAATCVGANPCKACKNCKSCKHCSKDGKTCGVCKPRR